MTSGGPVVTLSPRDYDTVLFDLDGVLTKTASVHAAAWKRLFDGFLDGKPRYDGVPAFLRSRGIELPFGGPDDTPAYYNVRPSHGATLSRVVHAWVVARSDRPRSMTYFAEALRAT